MTKEEILGKHLSGHIEWPWNCLNDIGRAMQEYADQETSEKNSEIERLNAELTELKEKHKRDVIDGVIYVMKLVNDRADSYFSKDVLIEAAEQYYKQTHETK